MQASAVPKPDVPSSPGPAPRRWNARWISLAEVLLASFLVLGHSLWHFLPNLIPLLIVVALLSLRLREDSWIAMAFHLPKSWVRTVLIALAVAAVQQAIGQFAVDPLTRPFLHYSARPNPMAGIHGYADILAWLGIIWTYAAFGEEILFRGYLINRVADLGGHSRTALFFGALGSSVLFGFAHWYQGPAGAVSAMASGLVFAGAYLFSGRNLWVAIGAHGISDTSALIATCLGLAG